MQNHGSLGFILAFGGRLMYFQYQIFLLNICYPKFDVFWSLITEIANFIVLLSIKFPFIEKKNYFIKSTK